MRLLIETNGVRFRAGGPARPKPDYQDKTKQAMTPDGRPIWVVRLTAFDTRTEQGSSRDHLGRGGWRQARADHR